MNNKGFTLIELIVTIALLAVIAIISFVSINAILIESKVNDCENLISNIKSSTKEYVSDNRYSFSNNDDFSINASVLIENKYLSTPIVNPFTGEVISSENITIDIKLADDYTVSNEEDSIIIKNVSGNMIDCSSNKW